MIREELDRRNLPKLLEREDGTVVCTAAQWEERRKEIREILDHFFIGLVPPLRVKTKGTIGHTDKNAFSGKAVYECVDIELDTVGGLFHFPVHVVLPKGVEKPPVFLYYSFEPALVNELCPVEEIIDQGYAIVSLYYQDIAPDTKSRFLGGVSNLYGRNPFDSWGTIGMWAWAGSRVMDYLETRDDIDLSRVAVTGHSRLGKTALWCGAVDERFSMVITNDSGAAGSALFRGKEGELIKNLKNGGARYWLCGNFLEYAEREDELPFDQHFELALVAPRNLYVSGREGRRMGRSEIRVFECRYEASEAYELLGLKGLVAPDAFPEAPAVFHEGQIGYHIRPGTHFLNRYDWRQFIKYRNEHHC